MLDENPSTILLIICIGLEGSCRSVASLSYWLDKNPSTRVCSIDVGFEGNCRSVTFIELLTVRQKSKNWSVNYCFRI